MTKIINDKQKIKINTQEIFGVSCNFEVYGFKDKNENIPDIDLSTNLILKTTLAILASLLVTEEY